MVIENSQNLKTHFALNKTIINNQFVISKEKRQN